VTSVLTEVVKRANVYVEKRKTNMAEEHHLHDEINHDDQSVMSQLLQTVKGLSPISLAPAIDSAFADDNSMSREQFQFE